LRSLDLAVVVLYFCFTLGVGLWVARHQRSATDYFLGARDLPAWAILLSIVATETSAITVISVPGIGARGDLTFLQLTFGYLVGRIGVARWLLPGYFRGDQETAYARLQSRFGVGTRRLTSTVFLVTRLLGDAVRVFASAIPLALVAGWSIPTSIVVMGIVTMVYTWLGGFKAVVWTDVLQLSVYLAGGIGALLVALSLAGGPDVAFTAAHSAGKLKLINPGIDFTKTYTLLGGILGGALLSAASHGTDHLIEALLGELDEQIQLLPVVGWFVTRAQRCRHGCSRTQYYVESRAGDDRRLAVGKASMMGNRCFCVSAHMCQASYDEVWAGGEVIPRSVCAAH